MRFQKLYVAIVLVATLLPSCACQSSRRAAPLLSSKQATPPALASVTPTSPTVPEGQVPTAKPVEPTPASSDPVADLIAKVEKEYAAGQENYKAGHLEAARQNFDQAFDLLLGTNLEINSDPRLENEFDRIEGALKEVLPR